MKEKKLLTIYNFVIRVILYWIIIEWIIIEKKISLDFLVISDNFEGLKRSLYYSFDFLFIIYINSC